MANEDDRREPTLLPVCVTDYISFVIKKMGYRRKIRREVAEELTDHFAEHLKGSTSEQEREQKAQQLIADFGDAKLLAVLMRRAKKRCRPVWQKVCVRSAAVAGVILLYLASCFLRLQIGSPTIKVDYGEWLANQMRQGKGESLNARPDIDRAAALLKKDDPFWEAIGTQFGRWPADMNAVEKEAVAAVLHNNAEALELLRQGLAKPYYWGDYNSVGGIVTESNSALAVELMSRTMERMAKYRMLAKLLAAEAKRKAFYGDTKSALDDAIALHRFGVMLEGKGLLIEQLVGIASEALAIYDFEIILTKVDVPTELLKDTQQRLSEDYAGHTNIINFEGEKAFWYDTIQRGFTDDGTGNGRVLKTGVPFVVQDWKDAIWDFVSFSYPDRAEFLAKVEKMFEQARYLNEMTPWDAVLQPARQGEDEGSPVMFKILVPAFNRVGMQAWRLKANREALLAALATLRFAKETGKYPEVLTELVDGGYLGALPRDPYSDGSLSYKKTLDGFLLYSWGEDLDDDGGEVAKNKDGKVKKWANEGDWVFWPAEKN